MQQSGNSDSGSKKERNQESWTGVFSNEQSGFDILTMLIDQSGFGSIHTPVMVVVGKWTYDAESSILTFEQLTADSNNESRISFYFNKDSREYIPINPENGKHASSTDSLHYIKSEIPKELVEGYKKAPAEIEKRQRELVARKNWKQMREDELEREKPEYERILNAIKEDPTIVLSDEYYGVESTPATRALRTALSDKNIIFPESTLIQLLEDPPEKQFMIRVRVFSRPELSTKTIEDYYPKALEWGSRLSYGLLVNIINNPNTPMELIEDLSLQSGVPVGATEPAKRKVYQNFKEMLFEENGPTREQIDHIYEYALKIYNRKGMHGRRDTELLMALAKSNYTTSDILDELLQCESKYVRFEVMSNSNTSWDKIAHLADSEDRYIRTAVAKNPNIPEEMMFKFSKDNESKVRAAIIAQPSVPTQILQYLGNDDSYYVRMALAYNPNTPLSILEKLAKNRDKQIQERAINTIKSLSTERK